MKGWLLDINPIDRGHEYRQEYPSKNSRFAKRFTKNFMIGIDRRLASDLSNIVKKEIFGMEKII